MSYDGLFTHAMLTELNNQFKGASIRKVQQPAKDEIVLTVRASRKNHKLLLSTNPSYPRIQITKEEYVNPTTPPNFCMFLRKYIEGAIILNIRQYKTDRIVIFDLNRRNEIGDEEPVRLVVEIMGRHSNIFLLDQENTILDCIKHVPVYQNSYRTILPNATYVLPPEGDKLDPYNLPADYSYQGEKTWKGIQQTFMGFGKDSARELIYRIEHSADTVETVFQNFLEAFNDPKGHLYHVNNKYYFEATAFDSLEGEGRVYPSLSEMLDDYYQTVGEEAQINQLSKNLTQVVNQNIQHYQNKLENLQGDWEKSQQADDYRLKGELLTTYLFKIKKGEKEVTLPNYYDNDQPVTIQLDPSLTPSENSQRYFHRYTKLNHSRKYIQEQKKIAEDNINYLESVQTQIDLAEPKELEDIQQELIDQGFIKKQKKNRKRKSQSSKPRVFETSEGHKIYVGRNNVMNDELTLHKAKKNHYWFHTQNIPGSHVILATDQPTDEEIEEAAKKAAEYSKFRYSANVPVDYTQVKNVKKPSGAKPGFVNYFNQKTIYVTPDIDEQASG